MSGTPVTPAVMPKRTTLSKGSDAEGTATFLAAKEAEHVVTVKEDVVLTALVNKSNAANEHAASFGNVIQRKADFVKVLAHLGDHTEESDPLTSTVSVLEGIVGTLDTASATTAQAIANSRYGTVVKYCGDEGIELPVNLIRRNGDKIESATKRLHYGSWSISAKGESVSYATIADLCKALDVDVKPYREAAHKAVGDERPDSFVFTVDGITVTVSK